jgi:hypothetical protein
MTVDIILHEFIAAHRDAITNRCKTKVDIRLAGRSGTVETGHGVPVFLGQLVNALCLGLASPGDIAATALLHGRSRRLQGFSISQVVYDYGDVCQSVTELAVECAATISPSDFRLLSLCLDYAIASAVTEYEHQKRRDNAVQHTEWPVSFVREGNGPRPALGLARHNHDLV